MGGNNLICLKILALVNTLNSYKPFAYLNLEFQWHDALNKTLYIFFGFAITQTDFVNNATDILHNVSWQNKWFFNTDFNWIYSMFSNIWAPSIISFKDYFFLVYGWH